MGVEVSAPNFDPFIAVTKVLFAILLDDVELLIIDLLDGDNLIRLLNDLHYRLDLSVKFHLQFQDLLIDLFDHLNAGIFAAVKAPGGVLPQNLHLVALQLLAF